MAPPLSVTLLVALLPLLAAHPTNCASVPTALLDERNAIVDLFEVYRKIILNGDPDRGIPVLDPLLVEEHEFALRDENISADLSLEDVRVGGIGAFVVTYRFPIGTIPPQPPMLDFTVKEPLVNGSGKYRTKGIVNWKGKGTSIDADGSLRFAVENFSIRIKILLNWKYEVRSVTTFIELGKVNVNIQGAGELGEIFNANASDFIEKWFADRNSEIEQRAADIIRDWLEDYEWWGF